MCVSTRGRPTSPSSSRENEVADIGFSRSASLSLLNTTSVTATTSDPFLTTYDQSILRYRYVQEPRRGAGPGNEASAWYFDEELLQ